MDWNPQMRLIVTAGKRGCYGFAGGTWEHCPTADVVTVSSAGAGDALLAGVLAGLVSGMPFTTPGSRREALSERALGSALDLGTLLGAFSVTSAHTIAPDATLETLLDFAAGLGVTFSDSMRRHWEL
jgi:sugar/nucleoside kinase (ribokinase family)